MPQGGVKNLINCNHHYDTNIFYHIRLEKWYFSLMHQVQVNIS